MNNQVKQECRQWAMNKLRKVMKKHANDTTDIDYYRGILDDLLKEFTISEKKDENRKQEKKNLYNN